MIIKEHDTRANVLQQSSLFTKNLQEILKQGRYGAAANGIHQSLWTLKHEVSMTRQQSRLCLQKISNKSVIARFFSTRFTVCVGHGLFVRKSYYDLHPLNEEANIEDTQYGLYQSLEKTPVFTIPVLENSETPSTLGKVTSQKRGWFKLVFDLANLLAQRGSVVFRDKLGRTEFISIFIQIVSIYATWFTHSLFITGTLLWALLSGKTTLILLWTVFYALYWLVPAFALSVSHKKLIRGEGLSVYKVIATWIYGSSAIMTHSLGPWLAIYDKFSGNTTRVKTER